MIAVYFEFSAAREMFSYFLLHSMPASILILCLKSQINSEGEAGVVCFGNINRSPAQLAAGDPEIFLSKEVP